jgi:hypothetical protein
MSSCITTARTEDLNIKKCEPKTGYGGCSVGCQDVGL